MSPIGDTLIGIAVCAGISAAAGLTAGLAVALLATTLHGASPQAVEIIVDLGWQGGAALGLFGAALIPDTDAPAPLIDVVVPGQPAQQLPAGEKP